MIISDDKYPKILDKIAKYLTKKDVELIFVDSKKMQNINKDTRGIDKTTDVLSFPLNEIANNGFLGSIVINLELAKSMAKFHSIDEEIALLFIHGLLHILGYDHEIDNGEMRKKEEELIKKFNISTSLIIRNEI